jgi:hypothetical protein
VFPVTILHSTSTVHLYTRPNLFIPSSSQPFILCITTAYYITAIATTQPTPTTTKRYRCLHQRCHTIATYTTADVPTLGKAL